MNLASVVFIALFYNLAQGTASGSLYCCADQTCTITMRCPNDQGYCYSRVVYSPSASKTEVTNNEISHQWSNYELLRPTHRTPTDDRGCTSKALTSHCTKSTRTNGVVTTCEETCQTNGCNDGWPNRPKCLQCISQPGKIASGSDECLYNPRPASSCAHPSYQFCVYTEQGKSGMLTYRLSDNRRGYPRSMSRSCSKTDIGTGCADVKIGDTTYQQCNKTCSSDGCNHGMGGSSRPVTSLVVLFATNVMVYVIQFIFSQ